MKPETPFEKARLTLGSMSAIARACGVTHQAVHFWKKDGIPARHALAIEQATNGEVTAREILEGELAEQQAANT